MYSTCIDYFVKLKLVLSFRALRLQIQIGMSLFRAPSNLLQYLPESPVVMSESRRE